jgi:hypothetical protein
MAAPKTKSGHIDKRKADRNGYFLKDEEGMPEKDYTKTCTRGFKGGGYNAHHILPQTAIKRSVNELKPRSRRRYITDVQYITKWNINNESNMIGLPHFRSYLFYYQYQDGELDEANPKLKKDGEIAKVKRYINTFNKWAKETRKGWLEAFAGQNPETYPIHLPVSWGHTDYNVEVKTKIQVQIWENLDEKQKAHDLDAQTVATELKTLSKHYYGKLRNRKDAIRENWDKRYDRKNKDWYKPFTMVDITESPLG